ncbi:hypothetical protein V2S66_31985 [Streptomyces sp. V4-01]|uniref:Uncharacterized protein n=1 Tax=Actinacidiphila polyblastidii TaxID=3110430 RepID=A0ABU7PL56_9ACTN|nr:hypothetical protein [Streptomyces sp. V4-01]
MNVKWGALGEVASVSIGATVGVVVVFALGVWALAEREEAREQGAGATVPLVGAAACFAACAGAVLYGLYLIIPQFH